MIDQNPEIAPDPGWSNSLSLSHRPQKHSSDSPSIHRTSLPFLQYVANTSAGEIREGTHHCTMGVKGDLKAARARMQAGEPSEAFSMIQNILDSSHPDLKDAQTLYAVLVTSGLAALASQDLAAAESSFRRAADSMPDAPQVYVEECQKSAKEDAGFCRRKFSKRTYRCCVIPFCTQS